MPVPTNRTAASTVAEHTNDHNTFAAQHNELEGHADATTDVHGVADFSALALVGHDHDADYSATAHDHDADYEPLGAASAAVAAIIDAAPASLDTLNELAAALGDDANFAGSVTTALAGKAATGHDHDADYEAAGAVATHAADTSTHGFANGAALLDETAHDALDHTGLPGIGSGGGGSALFGDGSDGVVDFDGTTTVLGLTPSSGVYTLTRDIYLAGGSQVSGTARIRAANFRVFCTGTFTIGASARVDSDGGSSTTGASGAAVTAGVYALTGAGGAGGTAAGAAGGSSANPSFGANGAAGGAGASGAGGAAGTITAVTAPQGGIPRHAPIVMTVSGAATKIIGGVGGGGGGGDGTNAGGGGGGGAGVLVLSAKTLVNSGTISANGGNGATRAAGNVGGGGGGGGGAVFLVYNSFSGNAATANGGAAGNGVGTGANGTAGSAGNVVTISNA